MEAVKAKILGDFTWVTIATTGNEIHESHAGGACRRDTSREKGIKGRQKINFAQSTYSPKYSCAEGQGQSWRSLNCSRWAERVSPS